MRNKINYLSIYRLIGKGYTNGWWTNCRCRYRCYKGARNTKKSYNIIGIEILDKILSDPRRNVLILRQIGGSNRYSTFSTLELLIHQPDINNPEISFDDYFDINHSTMTITYKPTGQLILFDGMLNPTKITSARMPRGYLTDVYIEEAFEIKDFEGFRKVDGSIRGKLPKGLFHQITLCFNAWNSEHWINDFFFKGRLDDDLDYLLTHSYQDFKDENIVIGFGKGLYLHTSTYKINEFRDKEIYDVAMEELRKKAPEIYKVEALGMWGNAGDSTYIEFNDNLIKPQNVINNIPLYCYAIGIDTGLSNGEGKPKRDGRIRSATTMQLCGLSSDFSNLLCIDEFFYSNENKMVKKTEPQLQEEIIDIIINWKNKYSYMRNGIIPVYVDCADIGFRQGLEIVARKKGLYNVSFVGSTKMKIQTRVDFIRLIMAFGNFLISDCCNNLIREIKNSRKGQKGEPREDFDDHAINANEYAWASFIKKMRRWGDFKER